MGLRIGAVGAVLMAVASAALATDRGYTQTSGNWATDANWTGGTRPQTGDRPFIGGTYVGGMSNISDITVNSDESGQSFAEMYMTYGSDGSSQSVVRLEAGGSLKSTGRLHLGSNGTTTIDPDYPNVAAIVYQTGGTMEMGEIAVGGSSGGGPGAYELTGGTLINHRIFVGLNNTGTFVQTGGTVTGYNSNTAWGNIEISLGGSGAGYNQSGGTNEINELQIGAGGGTSATYNFSAGTNTLHGRYLVSYGAPATITQTGGSIISASNAEIGYNQTTIYNHSGGSVSINGGELWIGESATTTYNLSGTASLTGTVGRTILGVFSQTAAVAQTGGSANLGDVYLGWSGSAVGLYNLSGGSLIARSLNSNTVGSAFSFTGGTLSAGSVTFLMVNNGGVLTPGTFGDPTGQTNLTAGYSVTSNAATLLATLGGTTQGTTYDFVNVTGAAALDGLLAVDLDSFLPLPTDTFTILTASGGLGGSVFDNAPVSGQSYLLSGSDGWFTVTYTANSVILGDYEQVPIPEPGAVGLTAIAAGLGLVRKRRRTREG